MQTLFSNLITTTGNPEKVTEILANPQFLLQWVDEIHSVTESQHAFVIERGKSALNPHELIQIEVKENEVIYHSTQGRLAYDLVFTIKSENSLTLIEETFLTSAKTKLPLKLLAPIAKHAFYQNLKQLVWLIETIEYQED